MSLFKWGSGRSTLFVSRRVKNVISIEYDPEFYSFVKKKLQEKAIQNVELINVQSQNRGEITSHHKNFRHQYFDDYVHSILAYPDYSFDVIIIDGRARNECLENALNKLKNQGVIVFDNIDRAEYGQYSNLLYEENWELIILKGIVPFSLYQSEALIAKKKH